MSRSIEAALADLVREADEDLEIVVIRRKPKPVATIDELIDKRRARELGYSWDRIVRAGDAGELELEVHAKGQKKVRRSKLEAWAATQRPPRKIAPAPKSGEDLTPEEFYRRAAGAK